MEQTLSKDVQERLDKINWDSLKTKYGISKESIYGNPQIATQLAYGQMTDLVNGFTEDLSGKFSLRAYPQGEDKEWAVKVFTIDKPKTESDTLYVYGQPITSDSVKKALLERGSWEVDGQRRVGLLNANGGRPISLEIDGQKRQFLVSIHQPTHRIVAMPVEQVKAYLMDENGVSRGRGMYGVTFTDEQVKALAEGKAVAIAGERKSGERFQCCVQFDAAQRQVVLCHPNWFKEAQKAGMDMGLNQQQKREQNPEQQQKAAQEQGPKKSAGMRK